MAGTRRESYPHFPSGCPARAGAADPAPPSAVPGRIADRGSDRRGRGIPEFRQISEDPIDCRAATGKRVVRSRAGVFLRWYDGGTDRGDLANHVSPRDLANVRDAIQNRRAEV